MNIKKWSWLALALAALAFTGCSTTGTKEEGGAAQVEEGSATTGAETRGAVEPGVWKGNPLDNPDSLLFKKVVYFDFDKSDIKPEAVPVLRAHAEYLLNHPGASVLIEGHCDERGSREYNIALGERRANSVKSFLEAEGVDASQLSTISYGEERPAVEGHDESAWSKNRRAVLVYNR